MAEISKTYYKKNLGYALSKKAAGDFEGAIGYCMEAIDFDENGFEAYRLKASCYDALKMHDESKKTLEKALEIEDLTDKEASIIYNNLGAIYHNQLDLPEAMKYYAKALAKAPDSVYIQINFAKACADNGKAICAEKIAENIFREYDLTNSNQVLDHYESLIVAIKEAPARSCAATHKMIMGNNDDLLGAIEGTAC